MKFGSKTDGVFESVLLFFSASALIKEEKVDAEDFIKE
jgi:hypothetical protein